MSFRSDDIDVCNVNLKGTQEEDDDTDNNSDWQKQVKDIEENDKWEKQLDNLPDGPIKDCYIPFFQIFGLRIKKSILSMLVILSYDVDHSLKLFNVLQVAYKGGNCTTFITLFEQFKNEFDLYSAIKLYDALTAVELHDAMINLPIESNVRLFDVAKFLSDDDHNIMIDLIHRTSVAYVVNMLHRFDEPLAKHCRLCRTRRMSEIEFRMRMSKEQQVPSNLLPIPGNISTFHKTEIWAAEDEKRFTFDASKGIIFFDKKFPVDLVAICDTCLRDVFQASSSDARFIPIYHVDPKDRKPLIKSIKEQEANLSKLIVSMSSARISRRIRDFSLNALKTNRAGHHRIKEDEFARVNMENIQKEKERKVVEYNATIKKALLVDEKVLNEDRCNDEKQLGLKQHFSNLKYHLGYNNDNPVSMRREHPHSWSLASTDETGMPVTYHAAANRFGTTNFLPQIQYKKLNAWKKETVEQYNEYMKDQEEIEKRKRDAEIKLYTDRILYIEYREGRLKRKNELLRRTLQLEEEVRVDRRAAERSARRAMREAAQEKDEREVMEIEDDRSLKLRFYLWECDIIFLERENMFNEELDQCAVDRFWGLDLHKLNADEHAAKVKEYYDKRVEHMRQMCIIAKIITDADDYTIETDGSDSYYTSPRRPYKIKMVN